MTTQDIDPDPDPATAAPDEPSPVHTSRLQLVWDVLVFQVKLIADGLLDLALSPIAITAALMGLVSGGNDPHQHFRRVLRFGRRIEVWINLFGVRYRRGTSDEMVDGLRERVFQEAAANPWLRRAGTRLNAQLDNVNASRARAVGDPDGGTEGSRSEDRSPKARSGDRSHKEGSVPP